MNIVKAYRYMKMPIKDYILKFTIPILISGIVGTWLILTLFPVIHTWYLINYCIYAIPGICVFIVIIKPVVEYDTKRVEIEENLHLFITRMGALAIANVPRKKLIEILSEVKEYGGLAEDMRKIFLFMDRWNLSLVESIRQVAKTTPSLIFADFLDRMAYALETGEDFAIFLEKEQIVIMDQYSVLYLGTLDNINVLKEIFVAIVTASMFIIIFIILIPVFMPNDTSMLLTIVISLFVMIELLYIYYIKKLLPKDEVWHNMKIRPEVDKKLRYIIPLSISIAIILAVMMVYIFNITSSSLIISISIFPLIIPGLIIFQAEETVKRCEDNFDGFIRSVSASSAAVGGSVEYSIDMLRKHDFGPLTKYINILYKRLKIRIDKIKAWTYFAGEIGSNLIFKFTEMWINGTALGGNPSKISKIISDNFVKMNSLRKYRYQTASNMTGVLYGLAVVITFTLYLALGIMEMMNDMFENLILPAEINIPLIVSNYNISLMEFFIIVVIVCHAFISSLMISVIGGSHRYSFFLHFIILIWVTTITSYIASVVIGGLLL